MAHHVGGLGGAVETEVLGHRLLLLGGLAHLLQGHTNTHARRQIKKVHLTAARDLFIFLNFIFNI